MPHNTDNTSKRPFAKALRKFVSRAYARQHGALRACTEASTGTFFVKLHEEQQQTRPRTTIVAKATTIATITTTTTATPTASATPATTTKGTLMTH